jgi:multiple sugar transport system permease protein
LEDCARLDGCGWFATYWHVLLPFVRRELCLIVFLTLLGTLMLVIIPPFWAYDSRLNATWLEWSLSVMPLTWLGPISGIGLMMGISLIATLPMFVVFVFSKGPLLRDDTLTG